MILNVKKVLLFDIYILINISLLIYDTIFLQLHFEPYRPLRSMYYLHRTWLSRNHRRNGLKEIKVRKKNYFCSRLSVNINDGTTSRFTVDLGITAMRLTSGRVVTRFNSDLISGYRCTRYTGNISSPFRCRFHDQATRYLLSFLLGLSFSPANDSSRYSSAGRRHIGATQLPPTFSSYVEGECTHARTHARAHAHTHAAGWSPHKCNACITRTSTMMSGEFAPGGTRMYIRWRSYSISVATKRKESRISRR